MTVEVRPGGIGCCTSVESKSIDLPACKVFEGSWAILLPNAPAVFTTALPVAMAPFPIAAGTVLYIGSCGSPYVAGCVGGGL